MLLIEQKSAKLIDLLEELRRDLPNVKDRHDASAAVMQRAMDPDRVIAALDMTAPSADSTATVEPPGTPATRQEH